MWGIEGIEAGWAELKWSLERNGKWPLIDKVTDRRHSGIACMLTLQWP